MRTSEEKEVKVEVQKEGVLKKLSRGRHNHRLKRRIWQKRDFILAKSDVGRTASLSYYDKGKCKGAFKLEKSSSVIEEKNYFILSAIDECGPCVVSLQATSSKEASAWITAIREAISEASKGELTAIPISQIENPRPTDNQRDQSLPSGPPPDNKEAVHEPPAASTPFENEGKAPGDTNTCLGADTQEDVQERRSTMTCQDAFLKQLMEAAAAEEDETEEASPVHSEEDADELEERGTDSCRLDFLKRLGIVVQDEETPNSS